MAFDGAGNYTRIHNWTSDASNGLDINAGEMDGEDNSIAGALNNCVTRDGQGVMSANFLPNADNTLALGTALKRWSSINGIPFANIATTFNQAPTNQQFAPAAKIQRMNDRVMVGDACINDGLFPNVTKDWLSAFQTSQAGGPSNGTLLGVQMAVLGNQTAPIGGGFLSGARTLNNGVNGAALATTSIVVNDCAVAVNNNQSWAYYGEAHRMNNIVASAIGMELDVVQRGSLQQMTPYALAAGEATGLKLAAGSGLSSAGQFAATAALVVGANPMAFDKGIVILANSISGTDGVTGTGYAINLAKGHLIQGWATGGVPTGVIQWQGTSSANAVGLTFGEGFLQVSAQNGLQHTYFRGTASAVNYLNIFHSATANPIALQTAGSDTNVDLAFLTQGAASYVKFGNASHFAANGAVATTMTSLGPAGSHATVQTWLTIKDNTGTLRYIPCY